MCTFLFLYLILFERSGHTLGTVKHVRGWTNNIEKHKKLQNSPFLLAIYKFNWSSRISIHATCTDEAFGLVYYYSHAFYGLCSVQYVQSGSGERQRRWIWSRAQLWDFMLSDFSVPHYWRHSL